MLRTPVMRLEEDKVSHMLELVSYGTTGYLISSSNTGELFIGNYVSSNDGVGNTYWILTVSLHLLLLSGLWVLILL